MEIFLEQKNFDGLLPILWTGHAGVRRRGRWAGRAWGAGLACVGRWAGVRGTLGRGARQGRAAGRARERQACGRAGHARHGARGARQGRCWARGRGAVGRAELARHRRCARGHARPGRLG